MVEGNVLNLYTLAFGQVAPPYPPQNTGVRVEVASENSPSVAEDEYELTSYIGTPIHQPVTLDDIQLPNEPLIEIRAGKRIVRTEIDSMDGTFKELFSMDDYSVTIRGIATQEDGSNKYPETAMRQIRTLFEKKMEIKITNKLANLFGINYIVINDMDVPALDGHPSDQPYVINAFSDKQIDIELRNG